MPDCIFCGEDAGKEHDLCLECKNKKNEVIIGGKEPRFYVMLIIEKSMEHDEVRVKFFYDKVDIFKYIIRPMLMSCGFEEVRRSIIHETQFDGRKTESILVRIDRIPAMQGHIMDLRKKYKPKFPGKIKNKAQQITPTKNIYGEPYNLYDWIVNVLWIDGSRSTINEDKLQPYEVYVSKSGKRKDPGVIANLKKLNKM